MDGYKHGELLHLHGTDEGMDGYKHGELVVFAWTDAGMDGYKHGELVVFAWTDAGAASCCIYMERTKAMGGLQGENEGYWRNGAMEREGKGAFIAMLFAMQGLILALAIYIFTK